MMHEDRQTMKVAVTVAPHQIEVEDRPRPQPGAGEALVWVERVGICGSDLHLYHGTHPYKSYPRIQGHEFSGVIVAFGDGYRGTLREGDRVSVEPLLPCGECYPCRQNRTNCCVRLVVLGVHSDGAFAEFVVVPTGTLYSAGDLEPELAALVEPVSIGVQAVARGEVRSNDTVVVIGAGPIGQAVTLAAVDRGARVMIVDRLQSRLMLARALGAELTVQIGQDDPAIAVSNWTNGEGASVVIDAVGSPEVIRLCFDLVAAAGRLVILGISDQEVSIPIIEFTRRELTIVGSRNNAGRFGEAVNLVQRHRDRIGGLITHRYPLDRLPEAFEFASTHPEQAAKVMIELAAEPPAIT